MAENSFFRGLNSESNVYSALYKMFKANDIDWFKRTKRYSKDDINGIDYWVCYKGIKIPLQVKSSEYYVFLHQQRYGESINAVVGRGKNLIPRIKRALRDYVARFRDGHTTG